MSENTAAKKVRRIRHTGHGNQVQIYLGKQLRFFINESDWKVLPMAAIIAGLVAMVIRNRFFVNMEGNLIGAFALTCVAIWNGSFNSIQAVCRERAIIKREHRSGLYISSYVAAHMIYQFLLCTAQTVLTLFVLRYLGVPIPVKGFMTPFMMLDLGITMLLITYAADMMSLFLSSISRTTTGAMTLMPFVLIFQLVFSGGIIPLPKSVQFLSDYTISSYGIRAFAAQSGYNESKMVTVWNTINSMKESEIGGTVTLGQILDVLGNPSLEKYRDEEVLKSYTVGEAAEILTSADEYLHLRETEVTHPFTLRQIAEVILNEEALKPVRDWSPVPTVTLGDLLGKLAENEELAPLMDKDLGATLTLGQVLDALHAQELIEATSDKQLNQPVTFGTILDFLRNNEALAKQRDRSFTLKTTVGDMLDLFGEDNVREFIESKTAAAAYNKDFESTPDNVISNWIVLFGFILLYAVLATIVLELIDKDKR